MLLLLHSVATLVKARHRALPLVRSRLAMSTATAPGETNLDKLLATMSPILDPQVYVFCTITTPVPANLEPPPRMIFEEDEGTTLIITKSEAEKHGIVFEYPCQRITLNVHSSLDAIGFLARITTHLATHHQLSVNAVAGFYHDHLFIPQDKAQDGMKGLQEVIDEAKKKCGIL